MPVSSYAPEFLELFKIAAQREITIPLGDPKRAARLRFRIHNLRREMRKEGHTFTTIANATQFSITPTGDLRCFPADDQFLSPLHAAGINIKMGDTPNEPPPLLKPERADAEEAIRKFFIPK